MLGALYQLAPPDIDTTSPTELLPLLGVALRTKALGRADMIEFLRVMPMSIQDLVDDTFEREEPKVEMAAAAIRDLRQGPRSAGTTFNLIHNMIGAPEGFVTRATRGPGRARDSRREGGASRGRGHPSGHWRRPNRRARQRGDRRCARKR